MKRVYMNRVYKRKRNERSILIFLMFAAMAAIFGSFAAGLAVKAFYPLRYNSIVEQSCAEFGVDESLVYAVIHTESGFDERAFSEAGAMGLMQIMPETFRWLQKGLPSETPLDDNSLFIPEINIRYGVYYLSRLQKLFGSDMLTIAAYHAGQGSVSRWLGDGNPIDFRREDIPSSATCHYVNKVERARTVYLRLYAFGNESA